MESNKPAIETKDLIELKKLLEKRDTHFDKDQIIELKILLDKEIERNNDKKVELGNYTEEEQRKIEAYKKILNVLNHSALFAAVGASGGAVLASTALGTLLLPGVGTILGALIPLIGIGIKAISGVGPNDNSKISDKTDK